MHRLSDYTYNLPDNRIAQQPTNPAHLAKLLVYKDMIIHDRTFIDLPGLLDPHTVIFFNDTKVMQSRVLVQNKSCTLKTGKQTTIVDGEIFVYQIHDDNHFEALVSDGKHYRPGSTISWNDTITLCSESFTQEGILFRIQGAKSVDFLQEYGQMPLPPYIQYSDDKAQRYQTCFARYMGSSAAPTASLHFTPTLLQSLTDAGHELQYATLHVGLGTFKPVHQQDIRNHNIHSESAMIDQSLFVQIAQYKKDNKSIIAVGTTMMRLLESLPYVRLQMKAEGSSHNIARQEINGFDREVVEYWDSRIAHLPSNDYIHSLDIRGGKIFFQTKIFIYPGFTFHIVDRLITNFHLPNTSLLMLVAACVGDDWKKLYDHAINHDYCFYSFGDGMIIDVR